MKSVEEPAELVLMKMMTGFAFSQSLYVAAKLGVADLLAGGPKGVEELAGEAGADASALYRVLRLLASAGVFEEAAGRRFSLTPLAEKLKTGPGSLRSMTLHVAEGPSWAAWGALLHTVRTGETAFAHVNGAEVFPFYAAHPESAEPFNEAMSEMSAVVGQAVVEAYDFSPYKVIADIGGGHGQLLTSILRATPGAAGVLFDQPEVVEGAHPRLREAGLAGRCRVAGGDFFESVPAGADAYVLKYIIHDWDEERALRILRNVHAAAPAGARLLLVESVVPEGGEPSLSKLTDVHMMVMTGGRERTEAEYAELFERAGFRLARVVPTASPVSVVEAVKS
jgi:hypothetical protein